MATLHLVNKATCHSAFQDCLTAAQAGDAILLLNDGVYATTEQTTLTPQVDIYVLEPDLTGRGLSTQSTLFNCDAKLVDYDGFVKLTEQYKPIISWY